MATFFPKNKLLNSQHSMDDNLIIKAESIFGVHSRLRTKTCRGCPSFVFEDGDLGTCLKTKEMVYADDKCWSSQ
jgi:hypothetical protein